MITRPFVVLLLVSLVALVASFFFRSKKSEGKEGATIPPLFPHPAPTPDTVEIIPAYFSRSEFDSPDQPGSGSKMDPDFLRRLNLVRHEFNNPMRVNSGYRTHAHNIKVGGSPNSSHKIGLAADIHCPDHSYMVSLHNLLLKHGFVRIGLYKTSRSLFIHVDSDVNKPQMGWVIGFNQ